VRSTTGMFRWIVRLLQALIKVDSTIGICSDAESEAEEVEETTSPPVT
jgi:hypothetical protein